MDNFQRIMKALSKINNSIRFLKSIRVLIIFYLYSKEFLSRQNILKVSIFIFSTAFMTFKERAYS
ncbi:MAG: hypothetical protein C4538_11540 [Nitrospiraceae bacterium]|nr:MAG: hypothetical protein C4538_11540 [Nitrospiraceae bacterium]